MASRGPLLLGIDIGSSRTKATVMDASGCRVGGGVCKTPFTTMGGAEAPTVETTVEEMQATLAVVLDGLGDARSRVVSVGIAGMAEAGTALGRDGQALGPVIAWYDPRGAATVSRLVTCFGAELPLWIGQPIRTVSSVAKLGWLLDHGVVGVTRWLGVPELCLRALTGSEATEHSLAARTGCYHVGERRWLPDVIDAITADATGMAPDLFAPVRAAGEVMGVVSSGGSAWSGLPKGVPVTLAGHDHLVGMRGCGASDTDLGNSVGTAESVVATTWRLPDIERALRHRVAVTVMPGGESWGLLAGAARAGLVLGAVATMLGRPAHELDRLARLGAPASGHPAQAVAGLAEVIATIEAGGPAPPVAGASPAAVWTATLRALSARTWDAVARLSTGVPPEPGAPPSRLVVFGGGSRDTGWMQAKASLGWLPVWRSTTPEAVARGAALTAGVSVGWWSTPRGGPPAQLVEVHAGAAPL